MKIVLLGYGSENQAAERFLRDLPGGIDNVYGFSRNELTQAEYEIIISVNAEIEIDGDLIVRSPSLPPWFIKTKGVVTSATKLFYEVFPRERIIAVTGTKGKGTTSTIIAEILKAKGFRAEVVGNIGKPALDFLREVGSDLAWAVYETSSFQAWDLDKSPARAVMLRIEPDHLDTHLDMTDYVAAKENLFKFQQPGDLAVRFDGSGYGDDFTVYDGFFWHGNEQLIDVGEFGLTGSHNQENALAALKVTWDLIGGPDVGEIIRRAFNNIKPLPHRMENLGLIGGVEVIDDNFSSNLVALEVAMKAMSDANKKYVLITGGLDKGLGNHDKFAAQIAADWRRGFLQKVFLIGQLAPLVAEHLPNQVEYEVMGTDFDEAIRSAYALARENGATLLMSPGASSKDMFKDYKERAAKFLEALQELGAFQFVGYDFNQANLTATFNYRSGGRDFNEKIIFDRNELTYQIIEEYPEMILRSLELCHLVIGTSYYKIFPSRSLKFTQVLDAWQAQFLDQVYQDGLSEYAYKNKLRRDELAHFAASTSVDQITSEAFGHQGILSLQSGGKDSLLVAQVLQSANKDWAPCFVDINGHHPMVLDDLGQPLKVVQRQIDFAGIKEAGQVSGRNGHVPVTMILASLAVTQAILLGKNEVVLAIAHEGEEAHDVIKSANDEPDLLVRHQWSKTLMAEKILQEWVVRYISPDIKVGSILRHLSEMETVEQFIGRAWSDFGHRFSSCNRANYRIRTDNSELKWCGNCAKCANLFLLMAPFLEIEELKSLFKGQDLLAKQSLAEDFKGLLGVDGVIKPFECVGEIDELRLAYQMAKQRHADQLADLPFAVPAPDLDYDYRNEYQAQEYFRELAKEFFDGQN